MNIPKEFENVFRGVELTDGEIRTLVWITGWEHRTVENLRSAIQKAQATALSTLQAENKRLNKIVCSIPTTPDSGRTVSQYDKEMSMCAYLDDLEAENEKLREKIEDARLEGYVKGLGEMSEENERLWAELEQVKAEKDAAVESIPHECKTCVYHTVFFNGCTPDHDCTNPDGGCSNNYDRWQWRGPKKED